MGSAERLNADCRADDIAVDVNIAGLNPVHNTCDRLIDACVQAKGQAIARCVDIAYQSIQLVASVAKHVQNRTENFPLHVGAPVNFDDRRWHEASVPDGFAGLNLYNPMASFAP